MELNDTIILSSPEELAPYAYSLYEAGVEQDQAKAILLAAGLGFDTYDIDLPAVVDIVLNSIYSGEAYRWEEKVIPILPSELETISKFSQQLSQNISIKYEIIFKTLLSFLAYSRYNDHATGWVTYNAKRIFTEANLPNISPKDKTTLLNAMVEADLLHVKVVGKKNPKLCYRLDWRESVMPDEWETAKLVKMSPKYTKTSLISQILQKGDF